MATATATQQATYAINAYNVDVAISILRSVLPGTTLVAFLMGILFCQYWIILTRQTTSKTLHAVLALLMVLNVTHAVTAILVGLNSLPYRIASLKIMISTCGISLWTCSYLHNNLLHGRAVSYTTVMNSRALSNVHTSFI